MLEERGVEAALRTIAQDRLMHSCGESSQKFWGILTRKERWGFSWRGWLLRISAGLMTAYFALLSVYPFLAITHRVNQMSLVVGGWIAPYAIRASCR